MPLRNVISHANPVMTSAIAITKVRLVTFLHSLPFYCVPARDSRHFSISAILMLQVHSTQTEILNFPINHILQVSCD